MIIRRLTNDDKALLDEVISKLFIEGIVQTEEREQSGGRITYIAVGEDFFMRTEGPKNCEKGWYKFSIKVADNPGGHGRVIEGAMDPLYELSGEGGDAQAYFITVNDWFLRNANGEVKKDLERRRQVLKNYVNS